MSADTGDVVLRVHRDRNYKTVHLHAVQEDREISWKAAGLLWYLISRPNRWKFRVNDLVTRHTDGRVAVQAGLKELEGGGYLRRVKDRGQGGQFGGWMWHVSEVPMAEEAWGEALSGDDRQAGNLPVGRRAGFPSDGKPDGGETCAPSSEKGSSKHQDQEPPVVPQGGTLVLMPDGVAEDPVLWMHELYHDVMKPRRPLNLNAERRKKYRAMYDEQLSVTKDPRLAWRAVLHAVTKNEFLMSSPTFRSPNSFLKNESRRETRVTEAVEIIEKANRKSTEAEDFAAEYRRRRENRA